MSLKDLPDVDKVEKEVQRQIHKMDLLYYREY